MAEKKGENERIEKRIAELKRQMEDKQSEMVALGQKAETNKADMQAIGGALQECDYWLSVLPVNEEPIELTEKEIANGSETF